MEEQVHYLVMLILQDGKLVKEILEFVRPVTLWECLEYGDAHREAVATYVYEEGGKVLNAWFMNNGSGTWTGYTCIQDPDKMLSVPNNIIK